MKTIIWVMWWWETVLEVDKNNAYELWKHIAYKGYVTLTGWRNVWVMNEALKWAKEKGWITLWILPNDDKNSCSEYLDIPIFTNMRSWRNYINALTSDILVICWIETWTSSEISLWLKAWKNVILVWLYEEANIFYKKLAWNKIHIAKDYVEWIQMINDLI